jgi:uncharacterized protein (DUF169 family)
MKARHGESVILDSEGIACPAAAAAFGFRPLPEGLRSGKGLVGFGIVSDEAVGKRMFESMPHLEPNQIKAIHLYPLEEAQFIPHIVIVEGKVESLMWIALAYLHTTGGERIVSSTAILQATCVDATIIPYLEDHGFFVFPELGEGHPQTCMMDGIQVATGATYGKVLMEKTFYGKLAATFYHPKRAQ